MPRYFALSLTPLPTADWADAASGTVHDSLWFLTRQWQLGEFQGENASTPVRAEVITETRPLTRPGSDASLRDVPPEPLVESELDDWWTPGRRLRVGRLLAADLALQPEAGWLFADPPPPYDQVTPAWDGLAMWRAGLRPTDPALLPEVPPDTASAWVADQLVYQQDDAFAATGVRLHLRRHRGGRLDWYSVDAEAHAGLPPGDRPAEPSVVVPARIEYAGMPRTGIWEIEDPAADVGALAPDAAHTATAIMTALFFSHRDEWFDIPVPAEAGQLLRIAEIAVTDAFGETFRWWLADDGSPQGEPGLGPPTDLVVTAQGSLEWGVFRSQGLASGELLLWQAVDRPLQGEVIERVQFGVDDQSNVVWAVERRLDQRDPQPTGPEPQPVDAAVLPPGDLTRGQAYRYQPNQGAAEHWIPYTMTDDDQRRLEQRRLVDFADGQVRDLPPARAAVLQGQATVLPESLIPADGLQVERRWMLARDAAGRPHLWIQRQRGPLLAPPARTLRFDVPIPVDPD